jgi:hypothetical protein
LESAPGGAGDRFAIGERFAFCGSATAAWAQADSADHGGWLGVRRVAQGDRFAIGERCAFCGSPAAWLAHADRADQGGWLGVRRVAQGDRFAIDARCACGARANAGGGDGRRRR